MVRRDRVGVVGLIRFRYHSDDYIYEGRKLFLKLRDLVTTKGLVVY